MNLLITNTHEEQPYLILRCLRHVADRIVITVNEGSLLTRWSGISAWSRHVSKRYTVPDCSPDWRAGRIGEGNTAAEEVYVRRIEEICAAENIDVIFPSYDAEVLVFAKNKERFATQGIVTVVPEYAALKCILDKDLTLRAARAAGFPIPATHTPANHAELELAACELSPPWVLKPRCNAHGANILIARDREELVAAFDELSAIQPRPLVQEYVPALTKRNYYLMVSPDFEVTSLFAPRVQRFRRIGLRVPVAAAVTTREVPLEPEVLKLVRELGVWGGMTLQTIVDARDGQPRLMEINPRLGNNLWFRTECGINEPLAYLRLARGEPPAASPVVPTGILLLDPLWDLLHLAATALEEAGQWLRKRFGAAERADGLERDTLSALLGNFRAEYFSRARRITSPLNRGYLSDPLPPLARIARTILFEIIRRRKEARKRKSAQCRPHHARVQAEPQQQDKKTPHGQAHAHRDDRAEDPALAGMPAQPGGTKQGSADRHAPQHGEQQQQQDPAQRRERSSGA